MRGRALCAAALLLVCAASAAPQPADHPATRAERALLAGRFEEVDRLAATYRGEPTVAVAHARALTARGRYGESESVLQAAAFERPHSDAALELGLLYRYLGRRLEARRALQVLLTSAPEPGDRRAVLRAARAARALGRFEEANRLFREALAAAADPAARAEVNTAWGELFLEKYNRRDAARSFRAALDEAPDHGPARRGLALALADENPPMAARLAAGALELNPGDTAAHLLIGELALAAGNPGDAAQAVARAQAINPHSLEAWALAAAVAWVEGRTADYEAAAAAALAVNPLYGEVYRVVATAAARQYRFEEAAELARRAIMVDRENGRAYADLGVHLMRTGDERMARGVLELAFRVDPYDVVTYNLLNLLDTLQQFETIRDGDLIVRLHPDEAPVMREFVPALARRALAELSAQWEFTPSGPILVEMFPVHDDFAVRNVGLPGLVGALGACFGRVVTLDSPRARPPGEFNWGATLWHEMAHVITLQLSRQRVPRWLTEGVSVYEERRARPEWGREMEVPFARALLRGQVPPIARLNAGFTNPDQIALAYYQASLVVDHLMARFGQAAVRRLVAAYANGGDDATTVRAALGVDLADLQASFDAFLEQRFATLHAALRAPEGFGPDLPVEALRRMAEAHPGSAPVLLALGDALRESAAGEALEMYERAAALLPGAVGPDSPLARLAELALAVGDRARAAAAYERLTAADGTDVGSARAWARLVDPAADPARAKTAFARIVAIDPFDAQAHQALGRLLLARDRADEAVRHFTVALAAGPLDRAAAHADLAEGLERLGRRDEAKRQTLLALEIAPAYERAQELLLRLVEGRR